MRKPTIDKRRFVKAARLARRKRRRAKGQKKRNWILSATDSMNRYYSRYGEVTPFMLSQPVWPGLSRLNLLSRYHISLGAKGQVIRTLVDRSKYTPQTMGHR